MSEPNDDEMAPDTEAGESRTDAEPIAVADGAASLTESAATAGDAPQLSGSAATAAARDEFMAASTGTDRPRRPRPSFTLPRVDSFTGKVQFYGNGPTERQYVTVVGRTLHRSEVLEVLNERIANEAVSSGYFQHVAADAKVGVPKE